MAEISQQWQSAAPIPTAKQRSDPEWERKQRAKEYRIAAKREKRNRKADEKKQRTLNATLLRRMTRNTDKYNKNAERNKLRAVDTERRGIWLEAIRQAERLAAKHDPTGKLFNVSPVVTQEDGTVISLEVLKRREERRREKEAKAISETGQQNSEVERLNQSLQSLPADMPVPKDVDPEKYRLIAAQNSAAPRTPGISKTQQKKLEKYAPKPIPPRPVLPDGIEVPEGEINWIALWDLSDSELERRVTREKKRKQLERKALRHKQQAGKRERRAARDEKRRIYRDLKETWKLIKAREKRHKLNMKSHEDREGKQIAVEINIFDRRQALAACAKLGFTMENTEGVDDIKPVVRGVKGKQIDWDNLDIGEGNNIRPTGWHDHYSGSARVDLSKAANESILEYIGAGAIDVNDFEFAGDETQSDDDEDSEDRDDNMAANLDEVRVDVGAGEAHRAVSYNHRMRRKIRRALDNQQIQREVLVRERAMKHLESQGMKIPDVLRTSPKPFHDRGRRLLENGMVETDKQERVRARIELTEFNNAAKILRRQAKEIALGAGLRVYAEMTGRIPESDARKKEPWEGGYGIGWHVPPKPRPDDALPETFPKQQHTDIAEDAMAIDDESDRSTGFELHGVRF